MTITAKFASRCAICGEPITPGTTIEWAKGQPVRHTSCPTASDGLPTATYVGRVTHADMLAGRRAGRGSRRWTGCRCGSIEGYSRASDCRSCRFDQDDM